ncbi:MAG: Trp family transcriptional regulator [Candidatus Azambacteria bacterium]|nr:Trp family transcriptional regulator [Candidatus Azambacteria bacterium]
MSQVSRNPLSKESNYEIQATLWWLLARLDNDSDIRNFLNSLLTKTEKIMLAKRLAIAFLLNKNYSQRDISDALKVSTSTVCRIKEVMDKTEGDYEIFIKKLEKRSELKKLEKQFDKFIGKLVSIVPPQKNDIKGRTKWLK